MTPFHLRQRLKSLLPSPPTPPPPAASSPVAPPAPAAAPSSAVTSSASPAPASPALASAPAAVTPSSASPAPASPAPASPSPAAAAVATPSAEEEEKQRRHWARTRKGMLKWLADREGTGPMAEMHDHSERRYFVAHRAFSRLMEEFTGEGLVTYEGGTVTLTDAGRAALASA